MTQYLPILTMLVLAALFAGLSFFASRLFAPRRPNAAKSAPYECGIVPTAQPADRFSVKFYLVAMLFIIFDIEIIFLYPWAVVFEDLELAGLVSMLAFGGAVFIAFIYLISKGALDWGPVKQYGSGHSTIRRVSNRRVNANLVDANDVEIEQVAS